jgi:hypothetical protein
MRVDCQIAAVRQATSEIRLSALHVSYLMPAAVPAACPRPKEMNMSLKFAVEINSQIVK